MLTGTMTAAAAICCTRLAAPGNPAWFAAAGWFTAVALAALAAAPWGA